ncbi:MAG: cytochrome o ubiquinol oxidase subunit III [Chloroflexota bacterium]|nr:MAG: cytochrome o ubiquinol oxidase subunit III [Chloroflexota bacterium]
MAAVGKLEQGARRADEPLEGVLIPEHAETSTGLDHRKVVMWVFIASESIFFAALMATYLVNRDKVSLEEGPGHLDLAVASFNTFILLFSSLTMVLALQAIERAKKGRMIFLLVATAFWGLVFLGGQAFEYIELINNGITFDTNVWSSSFFALTGFHGTHVLIGIIWIAMLIIRALRGGISEHNHLAVELGGLYWHFVDLVWVVLFTIIYLI